MLSNVQCLLAVDMRMVRSMAPNIVPLSLAEIFTKVNYHRNLQTQQNGNNAVQHDGCYVHIWKHTYIILNYEGRQYVELVDSRAEGPMQKKQCFSFQFENNPSFQVSGAGFSSRAVFLFYREYPPQQYAWRFQQQSVLAYCKTQRLTQLCDCAT